jgi:branched-chain amino acid aminotransferase
MGGIVPVLAIDSRPVGTGKPGPVTQRVAALFADLTATSGTPVA